MKTMANKKKNKMPITIYLTPEQIKEIFRQLKAQDPDWIDDPEMVAMLDELADKAEHDVAMGNVIALEALQAELEV